MKQFEVAIIGGGIVGTAILRELSRYDLSLVLLEKEQELAFGVSKSNSGIIHPGTQNSPESLKGRLCVRGNQLTRIIAQELGVDFKEVGELIVAFSSGDVTRLQELKKEAEQLGVPRLEIVGRNWLDDHEPHLNKEVIAALYAPTAGIISPYRWVYDLAENAKVNGATICTNAEVQAIVRLKGSRTCFELVTQRGNIKARYVINAAGLFADAVARMVGVDNFLISPRKGEEFLLDKKRELMTNHLIFPLPTKTSKGVLVIKTSDGNPMIGPTAREIGSKTDLSTTEEGLRDVLSSVQRMVPAINERDIIAYFAGLRPAAGKDFIIRHEENVPGCFTAAGIQSPGLTAAPAIAEMIVSRLNAHGKRLKLKKKFKPYRKKTIHLFDIPIEETKKMIADDSAYGDIVCRCEMVSRKEIEAAIDRGATTLDGIKFRTRAQAGRCHGCFCTTRILNILAAKLGKPVTEISKRGAGSELIMSARPHCARADQRNKRHVSHIQSNTGIRIRQLVIVGGGPAGMAAACAAYERGVRDILILERDQCLGGILNQCIHTGFGLEYFKEVLTGPEYAERFIEKMKAMPEIELSVQSFVVKLTEDKVLTYMKPGTLEVVKAHALIMATGCRERTREMIHVPGTRPAGIYSAGLAQKLINSEGMLPGKNVVIVGSGDIGLIMARRLTLEGATVKAVIEIAHTTKGLLRNVVQCLNDFNIPLYFNHKIAYIHGKDRVEAVDVVRVDAHGQAMPGLQFQILCDTVLISAGLIPENELIEMAGVAIDTNTNTPISPETNRTSIDGLFACGNSYQIYDLVDSVTRDSELAGRQAAEYLNNIRETTDLRR